MRRKLYFIAMKKVINVGIGGRSFCLEEDAYERLSRYLNNFKEVLVRTGETNGEIQEREVMSEIESRIAELLAENVTSPAMSVSLQTVSNIVTHLGMPDGSAEPYRASSGTTPTDSGRTDNEYMCEDDDNIRYVQRKLFRDPDRKAIGGVCSGLSYYTGSDITAVRLLMAFAILLIGGGLLCYIIMWIVVPKAVTPAEKCMMRGIPANAENMRRYRN